MRNQISREAKVRRKIAVKDTGCEAQPSTRPLRACFGSRVPREARDLCPAPGSWSDARALPGAAARTDPRHRDRRARGGHPPLSRALRPAAGGGGAKGRALVRRREPAPFRDGDRRGSGGAGSTYRSPQKVKRKVELWLGGGSRRLSEPETGE